nr:hypothetical protein [Tanacetum cinerariifolium]
MATTIDQQVGLDEALVPSTQRLRIGRSNFRLPSDIQSKESTLFFRAFLTPKRAFLIWKHLEMLHINPRIPSQSFAELPFEEEILKFLRNLGHSDEIRHLTDVEHKNQKKSNEMYYPIFTKVIIDYFMTRKPSIPRQNRINWHYVRDDVLFSKIKVVSRHQTTQQYDAILPIELTTDDIRNSKAYKEYYACAIGEAAPKPKASARKKKGDSGSSTTPPTPTLTTTVVAAPRLFAAAKGKQPARATTPTELTDVERTEAEQLKIVLKKSRQKTHISQQRGSGTEEGTGSRPGVLDVPSDDSEEELSWNSFDDEDNDDEFKDSGKGGDEISESEGESDEEETRQEEEESFDPIPKTPEGIHNPTNDGGRSRGSSNTD